MGKKIVRVQETKVVSGPDYWTKVHNKDQRNAEGDLVENIQANPDQLTEDQGFYAVDEATRETQQRVQKLLRVAKQLLTEQQYKAFDLCLLQCKTVREAARMLKLSPGRVDQLLQKSRHKLQVVYRDRLSKD